MSVQHRYTLKKAQLGDRYFVWPLRQLGHRDHESVYDGIESTIIGRGRHNGILIAFTAQALKPLIAHPDRCFAYIKDIVKLEKWDYVANVETYNDYYAAWVSENSYAYPIEFKENNHINSTINTNPTSTLSSTTIVQSNIKTFCKRKYYGIVCGCVNCSKEKENV